MRTKLSVRCTPTPSSLARPEDIASREVDTNRSFLSPWSGEDETDVQVDTCTDLVSPFSACTAVRSEDKAGGQVDTCTYLVSPFSACTAVRSEDKAGGQVDTLSLIHI